MYTVYALVDPRDSAVRYVGITNEVYRRFAQHVAGNGVNSAKDAWVRELRECQMVVIMKTLATADTQREALQLEWDWIHVFLKEGATLFNVSSVHSERPGTSRNSKKVAVSQWVGKQRKPLYFKEAAVGRGRTMEETREIIIYRLRRKRWPYGLSGYMRWYYDKHYVNKEGKFYHKARQWKAAYIGK